MKRDLFLFAAVLSLSVSLASAEVNFAGGGSLGLKEQLFPEVSAPAPAAGGGMNKLFGGGGPAEWTIMVYLNAKNTLAPAALYNLNQMEAAGSTGKVNIVVEIGRMDGYDPSGTDWTGTRRYLITKGYNSNKITSTLIQDLGVIDMGDYRSVIDFGNWAKGAYPARKYMLIMWSHGTGWVKDHPAAMEKSISGDKQSGNNLDTPQLGLALKGMGGVDVYGSDACLMQMAEVDYELKDHAKFIVGSEESEPGYGYAYDKFFSSIVENPAMSAEDAAKAAVDTFVDSYEGSAQGATQSYVRSSALPGFLAATNAFAGALMRAGDKDVVRAAMAAAQHYANPENKDLYSFTQLVVGTTANSDVKAKGGALMSYITDTLVGRSRTANGNTADYGNSHGLAVFMTHWEVPRSYSELRWARDSGWDELLTWLRTK